MATTNTICAEFYMEYSVELRETVICGAVDEEGGDEMDLMNEDTFQLDFEK